MSRDEPDGEEFPPHYFGPPATRAPGPPPPIPPGYEPAYQAYPPSLPVAPPGNPALVWHGPPIDPRTPNRIWAAIVQVLLVATIVMNVAVIQAVLRQRRLLHRFLADDLSVTLNDVDAADRHASHIAIAFIVSLLVVGIAFIVWLWRLRRDADFMNPMLHKWGRGWTIGGWLVPIMNFWVPFQVTRDVYRATVTPPGAPDWDTRTPPLLWIWWLTYVGTLVGSRVSLLDSADTPSEFDSHTTTVIVISCIAIVAAILAITVVEFLRRTNTRAWDRIYAAATPAN